MNTRNKVKFLFETSYQSIKYIKIIEVDSSVFIKLKSKQRINYYHCL